MRTRKKLKKVAMPQQKGLNIDESMDPSSALVSVLQRDGRIDRVKAAFSKSPLQEMTREGLTHVVLKELSESEQHVLTKQTMSELFQLMDVSKKGTISWDTFTSFFVDAAILAKLHHEKVENLSKWEYTDQELNITAHRPWKLKHMESQNSLLIVDGSNYLFTLDCDVHQTKKLKAELSVQMIDAEFVPTDDLYAIASAGSELLLYDHHLDAFQGVKTPVAIQCLTWNKSSRILCSGDRNGNLSLWHCERTPTDKVKPPILKRSWDLHTSPIVVIDCHDENGTIAVGFLDGTVCVVHPVTGRKERVFNAGGGSLNCLAISEHQNSLICGTGNVDPGVWTLGACEESKPFPLQSRANPHVGPVVSVMCMPHSAQAISVDYSGVLKIWDLRTFTCLQTYQLRMRDPKVCWQSLTHSTLCDAIYFCDRKSVMCLSLLNEDEQHEKKGYVSHITHSGLTGKILSTNINSLCVWEKNEGQLLAEVDNICEGDITAMSADADGGRLFVGTAAGAVWVLNASNAGAICRFPHAHNCDVAAICYVKHANVSISCSVDGVGSILKPPMLASHSDSMSLRTQPAFRCMSGRLCEYIGEPNYFILAADAQCTINVYDCKSISTTSTVVHLFNIPLPGVDVPSDTLFKPRGRWILSSLALGNFGCVLCDHFTVMILDLENSRRNGDASMWCRWYSDPSCETSLTGVTLENDDVELGRLVVSDDGGHVTFIDLTPLFRNEGPPDILTRLKQEHSVTAMSSAPGGVVLGLGDGSIDYIAAENEHLSIWGNNNSRSQIVVTCAPLAFIETKHHVRLGGRHAASHPRKSIVHADDFGHKTLRRTNSMIKGSHQGLEKQSSGFSAHAKHIQRPHVVNKEWVLSQLSTLCTDYNYVEREYVSQVAKPAFFTPQMRIPVFIDSDPFATVHPVDAPETDTGEKRVIETGVKDKRGSDKAQAAMGAEVPTFLKVNRFVGCQTPNLVDKMPHPTPQHFLDTPSMAPHTLLKPLRSQAKGIPQSTSRPNRMPHNAPQQRPSSSLSAISVSSAKETSQRPRHLVDRRSRQTSRNQHFRSQSQLEIPDWLSSQFAL